MKTQTSKKTTWLIIMYLAMAITAYWTTISWADTSERSAMRPIPSTAEDICPVKIGSRLPRITLATVDGKAFDLNAAIAKKPTILIFYRGGWCPFCNLQLAQLRDAEPKLLDMGYQIIAVSTDRPEELRESLKKQDLKYTLLSDSKMEGARALRIAFKVDDATVERYKQYGIDLEKVSGEKHHLLPVPSVFVLSTDGTISFEYINPNYKVRLDPEILLAAAKAGVRNSPSGGKQ